MAYDTGKPPSETNPIPMVEIYRAPAEIFSLSGTIVTGGVAQVLAAARPGRRGFIFQNLSASTLWLSFSGSATSGPGSFRIPPGSLFERSSSMLTGGVISIFGPTAGAAFTAEEC